jgi:4-hydroxy-3-polyprenylbenzoate decarboxylase
LPIQTCWPEDAGPLITWGLVITRGPQGGPAARKRQNLGIYRQQVIGRRQVIMRWLAHRGGALDFREFAASARGSRFRSPSPRRRPGHDPRRGHAGARQPLRYQFAGLLRGSRTEVSDCSVGDAG